MNTQIARPVSPRLRQDITFLEVPDGLYVKGADLNFVMRGKGVHALLSALLPHLDGRTRMDALLEAIPEPRRAGVEQFLDALTARGILREGALPEGCEDDEVLRGLAEQRALLTDLGADREGILHVTDTPVAVVSTVPSAADRLVRALHDNGVAARVGGPRVVDPQEVSALPEGSLAIALCTGADLGNLLEVAQQARGRVDLLPVWQRERTVLVGPWHGRHDGAVVSSAVLRVADNGTPGAGVLLTAMTMGVPAPTVPLTPAIQDTVAGLVALEAFRILGGVDNGALRSALMEMSVDTLQTVRQPVALHPGAFPDAEELPQAIIHHPGPSEDTETEQLYRRFAPLVGTPCGVFSAFADDDLPQLPIKLGLLRTGVPGGDVAGTDMRHVMAARLEALSTATCQYVLAHHRRFIQQSPLAQETGDDCPTLSASDLVGFLGGPEPSDGWAVLTSLQQEKVRLPLAAVLADPAQSAPTAFLPELSGMGLGATLEQATTRALASAWASASRLDCQQGRQLLMEVRWEQLVDEDVHGLRSELALLVGALGADGDRMRLFAPQDGAPFAVAWLAGARGQAVWASGQTWAEAARRCLGWFVAREQLGEGAEQALRYQASRFVMSGVRLGGDADATQLTTPVDDIPARLAARGLTPYQVDLTTADIAGTCRVVRVVLGHNAPGRNGPGRNDLGRNGGGDREQQ